MISGEIQGLKEVQKNIVEAIKIASTTNDEALIEIGERGVGILKSNTPVIEGRLINSMSYTVAGKVIDPLGANAPEDKLKVNKDKRVVVIGTNVIYAPWVEFMSKNGSAGYMRRSYNTLKPIATKIIKTMFKKRGF